MPTSKPFAIILCSFYDVPALTLPESFFMNIFSPGSDTLFDYWQTMSYGAIDLSGSKFFGPWTMQYSYFLNSHDPEPNNPDPNKKPRQAWIREAKRLAGIHLVDLLPFYGVIAVINGNADDSNWLSDVACGICWQWQPQLPQGWGWCWKCQALFTAQTLALGPCPGGGQHDLSRSMNQYGLMASGPRVPGQNQWRVCENCNGVYYSGNPTPGKCPSGGVHSSGGVDYTIGFGSVGYDGQKGWSWCKNCQMLVNCGTPSAPAPCAAGNKHDISQSADYTLFLDESNFNLTFLGHETGHALGLSHSFDTGQPGEYGDSLDIMSAFSFGGLPATFQGRFVGPSGPGLNAVKRAGLGWLPDSRIGKFDHKPGENWSVQVPVAALDNPTSSDNLMLKITSAGVYSGQAVPALTYTVEFRTKSGWDAGITTGAIGANIATGAVAIHMIRDGDQPRIAWSSGNKAGWNTQGWIPGDSFVDLARGLAINVASIANDNSAASVFIVAGVNATLPTISVRKTLGHKFDVTKGLRQIKPSPPFPADSLRGRLLDNPPQFAA